MDIKSATKMNTEEVNPALNDNLSEEQKEVLSAVKVPDVVNIQISNADSMPPEAIQMNNAFELIRKIYQDVLSPQLEENEILKREQKRELMSKIFKILKWQFIFTYVFVVVLIAGALFSKKLQISENIVTSIIKFVEFYITSIVAELLAILFFIVKNVFDKSIVDLIKILIKEKKQSIKSRRKLNLLLFCYTQKSERN